MTAPLALYDGNNRTLSGSGLTISQSTVEVTVSLNQAKEISISIAGSSGTPADGYVVSKVDYSPKLLTISGSKNALANISTVSIPSRELDITGASSNKTFDIAIEQYLPEGITLSEGQSGTISVTIELEQLQTESFQIDAEEQMRHAEGITEELKRQDQLEWVCRMNNIRSRAEEIVTEELVYE